MLSYSSFTVQTSLLPLTLPQLESIVRISEALAKMRLAAFTTDNDVEESLRLFQVRLGVLFSVSRNFD